MRATELKKFKKLLLEQRAKLTGSMGRMAEEALKPNGGGQDVDEIADQGSDQFEQQLTLGLMEAGQQEVTRIDEALKRIEDKTYGICEGCQAKIPKPRLEAVPSARYCVECQSKLERFGVLG